MDDKRKEDEDFPQFSSKQYLFPIPNSGSVSGVCVSRPAALFPCAGAIESEKSQGKNCDKDVHTLSLIHI